MTKKGADVSIHLHIARKRGSFLKTQIFKVNIYTYCNNNKMLILNNELVQSDFFFSFLRGNI